MAILLVDGGQAYPIIANVKRHHSLQVSAHAQSPKNTCVFSTIFSPADVAAATRPLMAIDKLKTWTRVDECALRPPPRCLILATKL